MNALTVDPATGFLGSINGTNTLDTFTADKKQLFLDKYRITANISAIARELGFNPATVYLHIRQDEKFKQALESARNEISDRLESKLVEYGAQPNHFMDRIAWLRAYRADRYNPDWKGTVNVDVSFVNAIADKAKAIDAELST